MVSSSQQSCASTQKLALTSPTATHTYATKLIRAVVEPHHYVCERIQPLEIFAESNPSLVLSIDAKYLLVLVSALVDEPT